MHATPESFGPNQSPLAAVHACARLPYVSWARPSRDDQPTLRPGVTRSFGGFLPPDRSDFNLAVPELKYGPLQTRNASLASRMRGKHQPLVIEANQGPPNGVRALRVRGGALSSPKGIPETDILLANPDRRESSYSGDAGAAPAVGQVSRQPLRIWPRRTSQPAAIAGNPGGAIGKSTTERLR